MPRKPGGCKKPHYNPIPSLEWFREKSEQRLTKREICRLLSVNISWLLRYEKTNDIEFKRKLKGDFEEYTCTKCGETKEAMRFPSKEKGKQVDKSSVCFNCLDKQKSELKIDGTKVCYHCKLELAVTEFQKMSRSIDGLSYQCKVCAKKEKDSHPVVIIRYKRVTIGTKICTKCKEELPVKDFFSHSKYKDGLKTSCKECDRLFTYGLTKEEYNKQVKLQNSKCPICKQEKYLCVDHDHNTNLVRGFICHGCNIALGHFGDNIKGIERALKYLKGQLDDSDLKDEVMSVE